MALNLSPSKSPFRNYILLAALTFFWGLNWPAMKLVLSEVPVWWFRSICLIGGGTGLMLISFFSGQRILLVRKEWRQLFFCGLFLVIGWHLFTGYGVSQMPAGRAVIIAFTMPIWASIFSGLLLREKITKRRIISLLMGLLGLSALIGPDLLVVKLAPVGALLMLGAAISWAIGTVLFKFFSWSLSTIAVAGWLLLFGAVPITTGAIFWEAPVVMSSISQSSWVALVYVIVFPMTFCQWWYLKVVTIFPANVAAISTLAIPLVGVFTSALFLGESIGYQEIVALVLISAALGTVLIDSFE